MQFFPQMPEDLTECQDSSDQISTAAMWPWQVQPNTWGWAGITPHLLGAHKPCSHAQPQVFHSPLRPIALENRNLEKGVPVAGDVPHFPQRRLQPPRGALGRGAALNFYRAAPKPQGTAQALQPGMGSLLPVLHPTLTSSSLEGSSQTQNSHEDREKNLLLYVVKKTSSSISCSSPKAFFLWGVRVSGSRYLHPSFSGTSYRCRLNGNMFAFRRDPTSGTGRKNLSIIFSEGRQLPLPPVRCFGG